MKHFSKLTIGFGAYIIISASFMLQVRNFFAKIIGEDALKIIFLSLAFLAALLYLVYLYRKAHIVGVILSISILLLAYFLISEQPFFAEKLHIIEYGILGYLALRDLFSINDKILKNILVALFFVSAIGSLDEIFQFYLPYRVGDIRDVATNVVSGGLGILQYFVYNANRPS